MGLNEGLFDCPMRSLPHHHLSHCLGLLIAPSAVVSVDDVNVACLPMQSLLMQLFDELGYEKVILIEGSFALHRRCSLCLDIMFSVTMRIASA